MSLRNFLPFIGIVVLLTIALTVGIAREAPRNEAQQERPERIPVPHIGRIQVLNGCGLPGAADKVTDHLRRRKFDVRQTGNAETWKYPFTMVVSRTTDMTIARQVAAALRTDRCILLRSGDTTFNVTVIVGPDVSERIP